MSAPAQRPLRELLRRPHYPGFVVTVSLSRIAGTMFNISGVLLVLSRTGSPVLAGGTAAAATIPGALSGPVLGAWLEMVRRRRILIVVDQITSIVGLLALLALAGRAPDWTLPAVAVVYSITRPFTLGSFFSALSEIAGPELLDHASAIEATSLNLAFVAGPALAGLLAGAVDAAAAIIVQAVLTALTVVLFALNPAFEARSAQRPVSMRRALGDGTRALLGNALIRRASIGSILSGFGWGLMTVGFPLYAARDLHSGAHAGGYLWAAMAAGSVLGTFALPGRPTLRRSAVSYALLGLSALLWPLASALLSGLVLVGTSGVLEGPAFSGSIALRQRHTPAAIRAQLLTTVTGIALVVSSAGAVLGGLVGDLGVLVVIFAVTNVAAAAVTAAT